MSKRNLNYPIIVFILLTIFLSNAAIAQTKQADFAQAELMLGFLKSVASGQANETQIQTVLEKKGMNLIIAQQNISRTVTEQQYKILLLALNNENFPDIQPADESEKAKRGVDGLRKDVWVSLCWGVKNIAILESRLNQIKKLNLLPTAKTVALRNLPKKVKLTPELFLVMGGRAGAAASENNIYFDILATSFKESQGILKYPTPTEISEDFFAHEVHHLGLGQIIEQKRQRLKPDKQEARAFNFMAAIALEGSATYLINGRRNIENLKRNPQFAESFKKSDELLKIVEKVYQDALNPKIDDEAFEKELAPFLGLGYHIAGALIFATIDKANGKKVVLKASANPQNLLVYFNKAAAKTRGKN